MLKFISILFLGLINNFAKAEIENCEIQFYSKIYYLNFQQIKFQDLAKKSNCKKDIQINIVKIFSELNGAINSNFIKSRIENFNLTIIPNKIEFKNFSELLANEFEKTAY